MRCLPCITAQFVRQLQLLLPKQFLWNSSTRLLCNMKSTLPQGFREGLNGRFERGIEIAKAGGVKLFQDTFQPDRRRLYQVNSSSLFKPPYLVDLDRKTCECPDHWKGHFCKHRVAASIFELAAGAFEKSVATKVMEPAYTAQKVDKSAPSPVKINTPQSSPSTQPQKPTVQKLPDPATGLPPQAPKPALQKPVATEPLPPLPKGTPVVPTASPTSIQPPKTPTLEYQPSSSPKENTVIWAVVVQDGKLIGVEVLNFEGDLATVRALPIIKDGKKLQPQFPFNERKSRTAVLDKKSLTHVKIFR